MDRRAAAYFVATLVLVAVSFAALVGVKLPHRSHTNATHRDGDGILSASSGAGGESVDAPPGTGPWSATFGGLLLCVTRPGATVTLDRVRVDASPRPLAVRYLLRSVPPAADRTGPRTQWESLGTALGEYPYLSNGPFRGAVRPFGGVVDQPCTGPDGIEHRFTELWIGIRTSRRGSWIRHTMIDYTVRGRHDTLVVDWQMITCGTRTVAHCATGR